MEPLLQDDIARARETDVGEKLIQALEMMATGFRLKRAALRASHPAATDRELDEMLERWLAADA